jgi:fumarate hydratase subunit beta
LQDVIRLNVVKVPFDAATAMSLKAGQEVLLSGRLLTARDAAHKRLCELLDKGEQLPVDLKDQVIYFVGPTPARPGRPIGSAGPTTSSRMDKYSPRLLEHGLRGMIGKGYRGEAVIEALKKYNAVHFAAVGGLGAILGKAIKSAKVLAYEELGTEAIRELIVEDFPVVVAYDCHGNSVYSRDPR